ncbi:MAG: carboxypeptidase-like regulatory domain-containing protein [Clostridiales bacterium]|nr:carboxypeptidase-like regulatory domain-containing protein [Clostridiales bacterium]
MSSMVYMYGFGFGGSPGRNVTVHVTYGGAAGSGANVVCTNGKKTFYGITDADGNFAFKLTKGTWTITANKNGSTSTVNAEVTGDCTVDIALFAATINVTYPAGSTCTATNGTTTLTAPDTSGTWKCVVPNAGTWTIKAPRSGGDFSETVVISKDGETKTTSLKLYLFNGGNYKVISSFVAKAVHAANYTLSTKAPSISGTSTIKAALGSGTSEYDGTVFPNTTVDLSGAKTLKMNITAISIPKNAGGGTTCINFGVTKSNSNGFTILASKNMVNGQSTGTISINVSSISGSVYLFILLHSWGAPTSISFNKIWLES